MCSGGGGGSVGNVIEEVIIEPLDDAYQDSDVDKFLEDTQETGEFVVDVVNTVVTGEPQGDVAESQEELQDFQDAANETAEDYQEALDNISDATTTTLDTQNQVLTDIASSTRNLFGDKGSEVTDADRTQGGDILRDEDLLQLDLKKSALKAKKKRGKKGLRIDYATNIPGMGKSGLAA